MFQVGGIIDVFRTGLIPANVALDCVDDAMEKYSPLVWLRSPLNLSSRGPVRAAFATSLGFGHVSGFLALVNPAPSRPSWSARPDASASRRGVPRRIVACATASVTSRWACWATPRCSPREVVACPTTRPPGVAGDAHEVEAAILLDPNARLGEDGFYHLPEGK